MQIRPGMSLEERKAAREEIRARILQEAEQKIAETRRSLVCAWSQHGRCKGEDPNYGGAGCLCECHDPAEENYACP